MGVEYRNGRGDYIFTSSTGILKRHDILINIITYQNICGHTIKQVANLVHGTIGKMSFCNNGLGRLGVDLFVYLSLKRRLVVHVEQLSR